ncbi:AlpA family phage regulatory protein [Parahaliea maris]|uniref:AlpA family phage regulatory protein n=1 Tax=Parahaliea maris TaxID=2716870 RepID=A0A5C8ZTU1_9GAMM|nr:AlpA family phage regulatory protein [Parahaliea maris]
MAVRPQHDEPKSKPTFLRIKDVSDRVGLARSTIYAKMSEGSFPESVKLSEHTAAWRLEDIED